MYVHAGSSHCLYVISKAYLGILELSFFAGRQRGFYENIILKIRNLGLRWRRSEFMRQLKLIELLSEIYVLLRSFKKFSEFICFKDFDAGEVWR